MSQSILITLTVYTCTVHVFDQKHSVTLIDHCLCIVHLYMCIMYIVYTCTRTCTCTYIHISVSASVSAVFGKKTSVHRNIGNLMNRCNTNILYVHVHVHVHLS